MAVSATYEGLKRNAPGAVLFGGLFAIMVILAQNKWANDATPIRSVDAVGATIKSVHWDINPTIYTLSLDSDSSVLIEDDRPHLIGSHVDIERVTRDNGFVFYRFAD
ncbi:hypothetical protein [Mesorhizobium sp. ES1-4]|uniref:hypothetical protein n=1 Tax=Mesorhizobium sp. ES1-4 TaxID=2876627 RepID=UPI001CCE7698|nr:hypothetical protein [Mesorhizobium sp. ES1-4]MBZ9795107.1 hypothetical protein [Mesorhizobium sp. ES1-4]